MIADLQRLNGCQSICEAKGFFPIRRGHGVLTGEGNRKEPDRTR